MKSRPVNPVRCAIYTRKSTEHGLELEFNSLDAQRESCEAYIKSQASEGWEILSNRYDDAAYSGGNIDRPALRALLKDVDAGQIDVVVVYKIDRLTRSLTDFAKLVEIFDTKSVSFVATTQQFNTTTSMGRLTLNVLLSFAQFERELSSERVRDKIAASRKKGKWTGGGIPLGYDCVDKRLVVNESEATTVRMIFSRYLVLKSFRALTIELDRKGIVSKIRHLNGKTAGGVRFTYGPLAYLLKNKTYRGQIGHKGVWFAGEHDAIVDRATFDRVQDLLKTNRVERHRKRHDNNSLLTGYVFDDCGNRMSPSFTVKNGARYPFYVCTAILKGKKSEAGSVVRISGTELEDSVSAVLQDIAIDNEGSKSDLVDRYLDRVTVKPTTLEITFKSGQAPIEIPRPPKAKKNLACIEETAADASPAPNPQLVQALVRAHIWTKSLIDGTYRSIEELSQTVDIHSKVIRNTIRLAFLAPEITAAVLNGEQPLAMKLEDFKHEIPLAWSKQRQVAGV